MVFKPPAFICMVTSPIMWCLCHCSLLSVSRESTPVAHGRRRPMRSTLLISNSASHTITLSRRPLKMIAKRNQRKVAIATHKSIFLRLVASIMMSDWGSALARLMAEVLQPCVRPTDNAKLCLKQGELVSI